MKHLRHMKEMVSTSSSSGNPSPRSSASSSARRRGETGVEGNPSRALNLGLENGSEDQGRDSFEPSAAVVNKNLDGDVELKIISMIRIMKDRMCRTFVVDRRSLTKESKGVPTHQSDLKSQWEVNYKEAAIFLEEGLNNDKFIHHPRSQEALPAYLLVHNNWFHLFDVSAALVLLALGFFEAPCTDSLCIPEQVHQLNFTCDLKDSHDFTYTIRRCTARSRSPP